MKSFIQVLLLCSAVIITSYIVMERQMTIGPVIVGLGLLPLLLARVNRLALRKLVPDVVFGVIDTGLLVVPAVIGGKLFGVLGAVVGGVVGDAVTDGIAGYFEGSVATWLRSRGIDEARTPLRTSLGKISGCLLGSGLILIFVGLLGIDLS